MLLRQVGGAYDESGTILRGQKMSKKFYEHVQNSINETSVTHARNLRTPQRSQHTGDIHETLVMNTICSSMRQKS